ncbi:MAG: hypothetical protein ACE366_10120 [Bradymonadia bacterium]
MQISWSWLVALTLFSGAATAQSNPFWQHWSDGQAELNGYTLTQPRYGQSRPGRAVLVYVTEPFSARRGVKVDRYDPQNPDHRTVLKLNHVRKFQTGVYDYSVMTSVFVDPQRSFSPLKISFSSQEWCGHMFQDTRFDETGAKVSINSYFDGESGQRSLDLGRNAIAEDALFIVLRQLDTLKMRPGRQAAQFVSSALQDRFLHTPAQVRAGTLEFVEETTEVEVPAGKFTTHTARWSVSGRTCEAAIEAAYPHRIVRWQCSDGESAALTGSKRMPYWRLNREGDEAALEGLGLTPPRHQP